MITHPAEKIKMKSYIKHKRKAPKPGAFIVSQLLKFYRPQSDKRL